MRSRGAVAVVAAVLSSSLFAPAPLADALADAPNCLELVSGTQTVDPPDGTSAGGPISDDGRSVLFTSAATNLGVTDANGAVRDVFVRDSVTGVLDLVSRSTAGTQVAVDSEAIAISADGRHVLFATAGALVAADVDAKRDLYVRDRQTGTTERVSTDADNTWTAGGVTLDADLSDDGRYLAYVTIEPHAVADTNGVADVYLYDRVTATRVLVSVADDESVLATGADEVSMSSDGRLVLFHSTSVGTPAVRTAAVRDVTAATTRVLGAGTGRLNRNGLEAIVLSTGALAATDLVTNVATPIDAAAWGLPAAVERRLLDTSANGRYVLLAHGATPSRFFVVDRVGQRAFANGPDTGTHAFVGDGGLVSSTSVMTTQAYVWRGPVGSLTMVTPDSLDRGTSAVVTLTGANLVPGTALDFGPGVSVSNFQMIDLGSATVSVTVSAGAPLGAATIALTAPGGCTSFGSGFSITEAPPPTTTTTTTTVPTTTITTTTSTSTTTTTTTTLPVSTTAPTTTLGAGPTPDGTSVQPSLVRPGAGRTITITGNDFLPGAAVSIPGMTVTNTNVIDGQHVVAMVTVPSGVDGGHEVRVTNPNGRTDSTPPLMVVRGSDGEFHSMQPFRTFDSRASQPVVGDRIVQLTNLPSSGARAVVANLTVTGATANSYLTTFAAGSPRPNTSSINFRAGETKANLVTLPVNERGEVALFNERGAVHVIIDVFGWYSDDGAQAGAVFIGLDPFRRYDSRVDRVAPLGAGEAISIPIVGPDSAATAVMLNVTVTEPTAESYLTVWPTDTMRPTTSNVNYVAGSSVPNVVVVPVGADGSVSFYNFTGDAHVIIDVLGVFDGGLLPYLGGRFVAAPPTRALDTRFGTGGYSAALGANAELVIDVRSAGVPVEATEVVLNITVAEPTAASYLTVWSAGDAMPNSSNVNFAAGQVTANLVVVPIGANGGVCVFNAFGRTNVIADVVGYYR